MTSHNIFSLHELGIIFCVALNLLRYNIRDHLIRKDEQVEKRNDDDDCKNLTLGILGGSDIIARHNSIIIARHFSSQPYINGVLSLVRASVINGEHGDEPFTRMNNSPIDSVPVQHLVPRHCSPVPSIPTLRKIR